MSEIFRYQLEVTDQQTVDLPRDHQVLTVAPGRDGYYIDMWALVEPNGWEVPRTFHIVGTGHPMPDLDEVVFLGTAVMSDHLVWHVFLEPR